MKKNNSEVDFDRVTNDSGKDTKNLEAVLSNLNENNAAEISNNIDDLSTPKNESSTLGQPGNNLASSTIEQLKLEIVDLFLDMKQTILLEEDSELVHLLKTIPLDADDEELLGIEPLLMLDFIRQLFSKMAKIKAEAQKEIDDNKENQCLEYEPQLQKFEADIREHIKIEQQMKLYTESLQEKLEEYEKGKISKSSQDGQTADQIDATTREIKELKDQVTSKDKEIGKLRNEIRTKVDQIQALELQAELVPILRAKIKELEGIISYSQRPKSSARTEGLPALNKDHEKEKLNTALAENDKNGYFDPRAHIKFKYSFEKNSSQKSFGPERTLEQQKRDESIREEIYRSLALKDTGNVPNREFEHLYGNIDSKPPVHLTKLLKKSEADLAKDYYPTARDEQADTAKKIKQLVKYLQINSFDKMTQLQEKLSRLSGAISGQKSHSARLTQIESERKTQRSKRSSSRDLEYADSNSKFHGKVTQKELMDTYGRTLLYRPITNPKERVLKRRGSFTNKETFAQSKAGLNKHQETEIGRASSPGKIANTRSRSVGALNGNQRAYRSKKQLYEDSEAHQADELKENVIIRKKIEGYNP